MNGGAMGTLMKAYDWSGVALGAPEIWPQCLRRTLNLILPSKFPMFIAWGPELRLFYNDASIPLLGLKHPEALGQPLKETWAHLWPHIGHLVEQVFAGEACFRENQPLTLGRFGFDEQAYFTFSFSPIIEDDGSIPGLLAVVNETSAQVVNDQRLAFLVEMSDRLRGQTDPAATAEVAASMMGRRLNVGRAGYGEIDDAQNIMSVKRDWTNGTMPSLAGEARILDAFGPRIIDELRRGATLIMTDSLADLRVGPDYSPIWESAGTRSLIVVPLIRENRLRAVFYLHEPEPRHWTEAEAVLARDVAERTWDAVERARAETSLRENESRLRLALDAGRMAIWAYDAPTDELHTNPELNRLLGYPPYARPTRALLRTRFHPDDGERIRSLASEAIKRGERYFEGEFRYYRGDGALRWFLMRAEMVLGHDGLPVRTIGVLLDVTNRKTVEESLMAREAELRAAVDAASLAIFDVDSVTGDIKASPRMNELYGYPPEKPLTIPDLYIRYHPEDSAATRLQHLQDRLDPSIDSFDWTLRLLLPNKSVRWVNGRGEYIRDESGVPLRARGVVMDISERKRWEDHQQLLIHELNHRVKNTLATVQSIASQTLRTASTPEEARPVLEARLLALSRIHDVLTRENWVGASLAEVVGQALAPYRDEREDRIETKGAEVRLTPRMALALALAFQELATNAVKYGALANTSGIVQIAWSVVEERGEQRLKLAWREQGGPPVAPPTRKGFGSRLIERSLAHDLGGKLDMTFAPTGLVCTVDAPFT
ncbi:MAG: HWE histidine kinase domain-containing protein [Microvirga sp.]